MSNTSFILGSLAIAFIITIASRNEIGKYISFLGVG